ncbi:MAG: PASTA domain-containing protein [Eggerthellaceae bacterium]|nr:PASTA domain-containing protein [Eggerthellaceae bacterium]
MAVSFPGMNQNFFKPITPKQIVKVILIVLAVVAVGVALYFVYADRNEFLDNRIIDDLVGDSEANARYVLEESDLQVVVEYEKHDGVEGIVLRTRPSAGYSVPIGSTVYVTVSQHRVVPACLNLNYATAETLLAQQGIYNYEF